jgi:lipoate-protein ligase A
MEKQRSLLESVTGKKVLVEGYTDLTMDGRKFSGNAQRRRLHALLFHGSFLLDADIALMEQVLKHPPKEPGYRNHRSHGAFLTNAGIDKKVLQQGLRGVWEATQDLASVPAEEVRQLVASRYATKEWTSLH